MYYLFFVLETGNHFFEKVLSFFSNLDPDATQSRGRSSKISFFFLKKKHLIFKAIKFNFIIFRESS